MIPGMGMGGDAKIGKITGTIRDASNNQAIEFATVSLLKMKDKSFVTGATTDGRGYFVIDKIPTGRYKLVVQFIGYHKYEKDSVAVFMANPEFTVGIIKLKPSTTKLNEVEVVAEKSVFENKIDRKVYNVEKDIVNQGGSASDVLQNVPSVSIDMDGKVSLRGSESVTILIDGRPSGLTSDNRGDILKQIPANTIESIELITNPSAKYDPEGMSGIINIVLKKNKLDGMNGTATVSAGTGNKYTGSINANYRSRKYNTFVNYSFRHNQRTGSGYNNRTNNYVKENDDSSTKYLNAHNDNINKNDAHVIRLGGDWYMDDRNTLSLTTLLNTRTSNSLENNWSESLNRNSTFLQNFNNHRDRTENGYNMDLALNYKKIFTKPKQELTFETSYGDADERNTNHYEKQYYDNSENAINTPPIGLKNQDSRSFNGTYIFQSDYTQPVGKDGKFEAGVKSTIRNVNTNFYSESYNDSTKQYVAEPKLANDFNYNDQVLAGYSTFSNTVKKFGYQVGLRVEQTYVAGTEFISGNSFNKNYFNFFPSFHSTYKLPKMQEVSFSFSRRINRPNMRFLNPFVDYSDPYNLNQGNPKLNPEYTNSYEIGYSKNTLLNNYNVNVYYRRSTGMIQRISSFDANTNVKIVTFTNLNTGDFYGAELMMRNQVIKGWNIITTGNLFQSTINGNTDQGAVTSSGFSYFARIMSNTKIKKVDVQVAFNYMGPMVALQGKMQPMYNVDLGVKTDVLKGKGSLSLNITDIFNTRHFGFTQDLPLYKTEFQRQFESRVATLTFSYRFGSSDLQSKRKKQMPQNGDTQDPTGGGDFNY
jgi:outer membrane receptor protein involved in Fe transport